MPVGSPRCTEVRPGHTRTCTRTCHQRAQVPPHCDLVLRPCALPPLLLTTELYGPLIGISRLTPSGASASGPSPYCAPLTPVSTNQAAVLRHQTGSTTQTLSLAQSLLIALEGLQVGATEATSKMDRADKDIETEVGARALASPPHRVQLTTGQAAQAPQLCLSLCAHSGTSCLAPTKTAS